jgi:hypothetical protein
LFVVVDDTAVSADSMSSGASTVPRFVAVVANGGCATS